jgi:hypothetical protein
VRSIDLLIPPPDDAYAEPAAEQARDYVAAFARAGLSVRPRAWTEAGDTPALALLAWGYHLNLDHWLAMLESWPADLPLLNPAPLMRWNTRKTYLTELDAAGVPTVRTWFGDADPPTITAAFDLLGADELVVKPQVSAGSHDTHRLKRGDALPTVRQAMIQPFLPAIQNEGEYSLFYVGGAFSHAICKVASGGDFRIQPQFGGVNTRWQAVAEALWVAEAALAAAPAEPLYARIDLLRRLDGRLGLIEFEAIEPDLYFHHGDQVLDRLAEAVVSRL